MSNQIVLKKVSAGFQTDMATLLRKFTVGQTVRLSDFSKFWREMKFSLVFWGRNERELRLFFEEIVPIILQLWLPTCSFREKVFGLYMLYAVYAVQPTSPKLKVRLRLTDWEQSEVLLRLATREQHFDVCYVLHRMRLENCFHYVAHLRQRSPVMYHGKEEDISTLAAVNAKVFTPMEKMTKNGTFQRLSLVHQQYLQIKAAQSASEIRDLALVKEDLYKGVCREISDLQLQYRSQQTEVTEGSSHKDKGDTSDRGDAVGARRRNLKAQQFGTLSNTRKGKRLEQLTCDEDVCQDEDGPASGESTTPRAKRARK